MTLTGDIAEGWPAPDVESEDDLDSIELGDIIDCEMLQSLMEDFYQLTGILGAILDTSGKVLVAVGWQDICTKFHRCHPETNKNCIESDTVLTRGVRNGEFKGYRCRNNMWDMVTPLVIGGRHLGNVFIGQFFYRGEVPDAELFRQQARRYGFDETEYLAALDRVPRFSKEEAEAGIRFYSKIAAMISELGFSSTHKSRMLDERKRTEAALRASEERFRNMVEASPNGVFFSRLDADDRLIVLSTNASFDRILGFSGESIHGLTVERAFPNLTTTDIPELYRNVALGNMGAQTFEVAYQDEKIDGYYIVTVFKVADRTIAINFLDMSERRRAEDELKEKERVEREILDGMLDAVISVDEAGAITSFNKAAETMFGYGSAEVIGENVEMLISEPDSSNRDVNIRDTIEIGDTSTISTVRTVTGLRKDKSTIPLRWSISELPLSASETSTRRFIFTCHDLTESKKQEEIIRRAQKMDALGKLTGGIAHDFNNLLVVVSGYSEILEETLSDQPELREYAHEIHNAGERGSKLTRKLLSYSRRQPAEEIKVEINGLLRTQRDILQKGLTIGVDVRLDLGEELWPVLLDKSDLEDTIANLAINAKYAMEDYSSDKLLTIRTRNKVLDETDASAIGLTAGDYVQLCFTDTGCGMDHPTIEKIFDPFFTTKGGKGTGLGLSQAFAFVKRTGGTIKVYSELGTGSSFLLYFPRCPGEEVSDATESRLDQRDYRGDETILVVDDEEALRKLASQLLRRKGYRVLCAGSGAKALEMLEREDIHLMLSDVIMPGMDGYELASEVRQKHPDVRIQLASGFARTSRAEVDDEGLYMNMLHKPFESREMYKVVRDLLDS